MRCLERNKRRMWHARRGQIEVIDLETGLGTGEYVSGPGEVSSLMANAAPPTGDASSSPFGTETGYALVVVMDSNPLGIREGDLMWLRPDEPGPGDTASAYEVTRVSESINYVALGLDRRQGS